MVSKKKGPKPFNQNGESLRRWSRRQWFYLPKMFKNMFVESMLNEF